MMKFISKDIKMPFILFLKEVLPSPNTALSVVRVVVPKRMDIRIILEVSMKKKGSYPSNLDQLSLPIIKCI